MATYEFICKNCGKVHDLIFSYEEYSNSGPLSCECGGDLRRFFGTPPGVVVK